MADREKLIAEITAELGQLLAAKVQQHSLTWQDVTSVMATLFLEVMMKTVDIRIEERFKEFKAGANDDCYQ